MATAFTWVKVAVNDNGLPSRLSGRFKVLLKSGNSNPGRRIYFFFRGVL